MGSGKGLLIIDANVLIDLCEADRTVIRLFFAHGGTVHVPLPVLREEVAQIDAAEYADLGIVPVEPPLQTATDAAVRRAGLSFHDHLCLLLAEDIGRAIQRANPRFITDEVITGFLERIGLAPKKRVHKEPRKKT